MSSDAGIVLGSREEVLQLAETLLASGSTHLQAGRYAEALNPLRQALDVYQKLGDQPGEARSRTAIGRVLVKEGHTEEALELFEAALEVWRQLGDRGGMATGLHEIGSLHAGRGDLEPALACLNESHSLRSAIGDESGIAHLLVLVGMIRRMQGAYDEAIAACEEARSIYERLGDRGGIAKCLVNLGNVFTVRGESPRAVRLLREAQSIWEALGNRDQSAEVLNSVATLYHATGDHAKAREFYSRALTTFEELGNVARQSSVLNNLGATAKNLGRFQEAVAYLERSIELKRQLGDRHLISNPLSNLANLSYMLGNFQVGIQHGEESLTLKREMGDRKGEVNALLNIARCHGGAECWSDACQHADEALTLARRLGIPDLVCDCLFSAARCRMRLGEWEEAAELAAEGADLAKGIKDPEFDASFASLLGELAWWRGDRVQGDTDFITAVSTLGRLESKHHLGVAYFNAGHCYGEHREDASALSYLERAREIFVSLGASGWVVRTGLAIGRYCGRHDPVTAAMCLSEAMELAEGLGDAEGASRAREVMQGLRSVVDGFSPGGHLSVGKLPAVYQLGATLNQILDLDELLTRLLDQVISNLRADRGVIDVALGEQLGGGDSEPGRSSALRRIELARAASGQARSDPGRIGRDVRRDVEATGEPLLGRDAKSDDRFRAYEPVQRDGATSFLCVPFQIKGERVGIIYVDNLRPGMLFGEPELDFLRALCNIAAPAVENARLYEQLRLAKEMLDQENVELRREVGRRYQYENFIGHSDAMQEVFAVVAKVARSRVNVLIRGESGTGKELVAKTIHYNSERRDGPFVKLNCAALPESLVESELFGVERGTATGVEKRIGKFEQATGGTLFLDEVGDMPLTTQVKVLRVLQEREFERVGGRSPIQVDVRVISATHTDLEEAIAHGRFRADLFYRLNVVSCKVPPLRQRRSDIPALVKHFLQAVTAAESRQVAGLNKEAWDRLMSYSWPGNVRELENAIEQAVVLCEGERITPAHLPLEVRRGATGGGGGGERRVPPEVAPPVSGPLDGVLETAEEAAIRSALERCGGNKSRTAAELGISRVTLYAKMKKHGLR